MRLFKSPATALTAALCGAASLALVAGVRAQEADQKMRNLVRPDLPGAVLFDRQCAPCHGTGLGDDGSPMLPGTATLEARYKGALPGALELRDDLNSAVLKIFIRRGVGSMPSFRKSELSDENIDQIADYLKATAELNR